MELKELISHLPHVQVYGSQEISITDVTNDSRNVSPGALFIAKRGISCHGEQFIPSALERGACAILSSTYFPQYSSCTQLIHPDVSSIESVLLPLFYGKPALFLVGITGTNGKTTTSYLVHHLLNPCGLIGTIEYKIGSSSLPSNNTTPDLLRNYRLFSQMRQAGCTACVMEVSSHALVQGRVRGLEFDAAVFTNLTQDHLDYHQTMEHYLEAKARLFSETPPRLAIVNGDSPYMGALLKKSSSQVLTYGFGKDNRLLASDLHLKPAHLSMKVFYQGKQSLFKVPLIGRHNAYNLLAAIGVGIAQGKDLQEIATAFQEKICIPGRLESIPNQKGIEILVDYAHTEDALLHALTTLKEIATGRLITVFGCGGNRDPYKRPKMGAVVNHLSDIAVVTSDNPRNEDPDAIIAQIREGMTNKKTTHIIPDRYEAIRCAIELARPGDIVLIAGKGHEQGQIVKQEILPFDDRHVAKMLGNFV